LAQVSYEAADIYFYVTDGQGCQVSNAKVMFLAPDGGHFIYSPNAIYDPSSPPNEYWLLRTDANGYAIAKVAFKPQECIPPIEGLPQPKAMRLRGTLIEALLTRETTVTIVMFDPTAPW